MYVPHHGMLDVNIKRKQPESQFPFNFILGET